MNFPALIGSVIARMRPPRPVVTERPIDSIRWRGGVGPRIPKDVVGKDCVPAKEAKQIIAVYKKYARSEGYPHEEAWRHVHAEVVGKVLEIFSQVSDDMTLRTDIGGFHEDDSSVLCDSVVPGSTVYWIWGKWYYGWREGPMKRAPDTEENVNWRRLVGVRLPDGTDPYIVEAEREAKLRQRRSEAQSDGI